ncbi:MAG: acyl-CoA dehydrogenase family protein [Pseudomonadales bacterium]
MDFEDSPEEARFRAEAQKWLAEQALQYDLGTFEQLSFEEQLALGRKFQLSKSQSGYAKVTWPRELGGRDGTAMEAVIYDQEELKYNFPTVFFGISLGMPIPVMRRFATEEQKARYIPPALRGEEIWCQLFSEPAAGSDLGGIRLKADRDGDDWVLNGQKIWTSFAHISDYGVIVTRSDPTVPKHRGMTYFFLDMKSPGIEIRQIIQASGGDEFCEVFFNDVRVPDSQRLGEINGGWQVAIATLMEERFAVSGAAGGGPSLLDTMRFLRDTVGAGPNGLDDPIVRDKLAEWYCLEAGVENFYSRALTGLSRGNLPGPEGALSKLIIAKKLQTQSAAVMDFAGPASVVYPEGKPPSRANDYRIAWLEGAGYRIAGGTDEILRNTLAEHVLGLPGDIRVDKDIPFNEL